MSYDSMLGSHVPRRGNRFSKWLGAFVLQSLGWRITGTLPNVPKMVVIGAPHTSNWDGVIGVTVVLALGLKISLMGKDSLFFGPFGPVLRWLGLIPIQRDSAAGVVEQSVEKFNERDALFLGLAPEGTRHSAKDWKTGFYRIAEEAEVPILLACFNYQKRELQLLPVLHPCGDMAADMAKIFSLYRGAVPKHPERLSLPLR